MVSVQGSVRAPEEGVKYGMGMGMGVSIGNRGGSAGQRAVNAPGHGRVVRNGKERECGSAEAQMVKVWCRADESVVGVKREAVGFQATSGDGTAMMICDALHDFPMLEVKWTVDASKRPGCLPTKRDVSEV